MAMAMSRKTDDALLMFPRLLREARARAGLTQAELARRARFQPAHISHFENGTQLPSLKSFVRLCRGLGTSAEGLLPGLWDRGPR